MIMEDLANKSSTGMGDKEIVYSKAIKAGKRIYYLDVKKNLKEDLFIAITESKRNQSKEGEPVTFEKHKIFLYKEDFDKFMDGMSDIICFIKDRTVSTSYSEDFNEDEMLSDDTETNEL